MRSMSRLRTERSAKALSSASCIEGNVSTYPKNHTSPRQQGSPSKNIWVLVIPRNPLSVVDCTRSSARFRKPTSCAPRSRRYFCFHSHLRFTTGLPQVLSSGCSLFSGELAFLPVGVPAESVVPKATVFHRTLTYFLGAFPRTIEAFQSDTPKYSYSLHLVSLLHISHSFLRSKVSQDTLYLRDFGDVRLPTVIGSRELQMGL
jgi:hypothetical protein